MHIVFSLTTCLLSCIKVASHQESQTMVCQRFVLLNAAACLIAIEEDFFLGEALGIRLNYLHHFLRVFNVVMAWCMKCSCCALLYVVSCEKLHPLTFHSYSLVLCLNCVVSLFPWYVARRFPFSVPYRTLLATTIESHRGQFQSSWGKESEWMFWDDLKSFSIPFHNFGRFWRVTHLACLMMWWNRCIELWGYFLVWILPWVFLCEGALCDSTELSPAWKQWRKKDFTQWFQPIW